MLINAAVIDAFSAWLPMPFRSSKDWPLKNSAPLWDALDGKSDIVA